MPQLTASTSAPINTGTFTGRQFVAGEDPLQTEAINLATARSWFLSTIFRTSTNTNGTWSRGRRVGSIASFMSPYQQGVIDETLRQYDVSRQGGLQNIADQAAQCWCVWWW